MAVLQLLVAIFLFTQCFSREPSCKQFEYEEKMLNKMIRTEVAMEDLVKRLDSMEKKVENEIKSFTDGLKARLGDLLKGSSVDGGWAEWSAWTECTTTCGVGIQSRYRSCDNPSRFLNGRICNGSPFDYRSCVNSQCQELRIGNTISAVGFTARSPSTYRNGVLTFSLVYTNYGDHFNKDTGKFVCQVPGLYFFSATILGSSGTTGSCYCYLKVGSRAKTAAYAHTKHTGDFPSGSASLVYQLEKGDEVYLGECTNYNNLDGLTHFTGFLIQ